MLNIEHIKMGLLYDDAFSSDRGNDILARKSVYTVHVCIHICQKSLFPYIAVNEGSKQQDSPQYKRELFKTISRAGGKCPENS